MCHHPAFDDQTSTFIIPAGAGFEVIFCPGGRSTTILATSKAELTQLAQQGHVKRSFGTVEKADLLTRGLDLTHFRGMGLSMMSDRSLASSEEPSLPYGEMALKGPDDGAAVLLEREQGVAPLASDLEARLYFTQPARAETTSPPAASQLVLQQTGNASRFSTVSRKAQFGLLLGLAILVWL